MGEHVLLLDTYVDDDRGDHEEDELDERNVEAADEGEGLHAQHSAQEEASHAEDGKRGYGEERHTQDAIAAQLLGCGAQIGHAAQRPGEQRRGLPARQPGTEEQR
eukprot:scaffold5926_cov65-Phaeocystis_antarctica.AAC.8